MLKLYTLIIALLIGSIHGSQAQEYMKNDFAGTWYGSIVSEQGGYSVNTELNLNSDGTYYESSGELMPTIYPNTQTWDYDAATNRLHFQYLQTVYAGQRFYTHFFYEIIKLENGMLVLHYNFWDDEEAHPDVQAILLSRSPTSIEEDRNVANKELIGVFDMLGRELPLDTKGVPVFHVFSDGTAQKVFEK